jgi:abnormal spindle-like microcephaly-associated protein
MSLLPDATPCPAGLGTPLLFSNSKYYLDNDDTIATEYVDFTTELRAQFRAAPPRRGRLGTARRPTTYAIHEDQETNSSNSPLKKSAKGTKQTRAFGNILSQPAQRFKPAQSTTSDTRISADPVPTTSIRRAPPANSTDTALILSHPNPSNLQNDRRRRGTVYIPSEDTTIPSVFLGIFSPIKSQAQLQAESEALGRIEEQIVKKKASKKSLAAAPKRAPLALQPSLRPIQETVGHEDVCSGRQGKENIPPSAKLNPDFGKFDNGSIAASELPVRPSSKRSRISTLDSDIVHLPAAGVPDVAPRQKPTGNYQGGQSLAFRTSRQSPGSSKPSAQMKPTMKKPKTVAKSFGPQLVVALASSTESGLNRCLPSGSTASRASLPIIRQHYPLITQDIQYCHLYEDNWLDHQEYAYTQLINHLFDSSRGIQTAQPSAFMQASLQQSLLRDYHTPLFSELYQRVKASIEHGALAMPKESKEKVRLEKDVGQKRKFLDIWLDTYDATALGAAAEVVIGRVCFQPHASMAKSDELGVSSKGIKSEKRALEDFLTTFFIRNEDKSLDDDEHMSVGPGQDGDSWKHIHTTLRSLMLLLLLDRVKEKSRVFPGCLFKSDSAHKSSVDVLKTLKDVLLPSLGDISRPLSHLGYELQHHQSPLDEYDYRIVNLATDLRDGVCLAHLVELLQLYVPSISQDGISGFAEELQEPDDAWPLSKQLKFPALSKATQVFNVQISLDMLSKHDSVKTIVQGIRAEDIVNGHREKTLALLWALVGKYGLASLVDMEDMKGEIRRLTRHQIDLDAMIDGVEGSSEQCEILLKEWAGALGRLRGIPIGNLTTDFAGQTGYHVFEAIVDEYEAYLPVNSIVRRGEKGLGGLRFRLQALGCSSQFGLFYCPHAPLDLFVLISHISQGVRTQEGWVDWGIQLPIQP